MNDTEKAKMCLSTGEIRQCANLKSHVNSIQPACPWSLRLILWSRPSSRYLENNNWIWRASSVSAMLLLENELKIKSCPKIFFDEVGRWISLLSFDRRRWICNHFITHGTLKTHNQETVWRLLSTRYAWPRHASHVLTFRGDRNAEVANSLRLRPC